MSSDEGKNLKDKIANFIKKHYRAKDDANKSSDKVQKFEENVNNLQFLRESFETFKDVPDELLKSIEKAEKDVNKKVNINVLEGCLDELIKDLKVRFCSKVEDISDKNTDDRETAEKLLVQLKNALNLTILSIWVTAKKSLEEDAGLDKIKGRKLFQNFKY